MLGLTTSTICSFRIKSLDMLTLRRLDTRDAPYGGCRRLIVTGDTGVHSGVNVATHSRIGFDITLIDGVYSSQVLTP